MKLNKVKEVVKELDEKLEETDDSYKGALILVSLMNTKHTIGAIKHFTKLPYNFVRDFIKNLQKSKVIKDGKIYCEWMDKETGGIAFWMDVNIGLGLLKRG